MRRPAGTRPTPNHLSGDRRGTGQRRDKPSAEHVLPQLKRLASSAIDRLRPPAVLRPRCGTLQHHVPDARHEAQFVGRTRARSSNSVNRSLLATVSRRWKASARAPGGPDVAAGMRIQRDRGVTARLEPATRLAPEAHHLALDTWRLGCADAGVISSWHVVGSINNGD